LNDIQISFSDELEDDECDENNIRNHGCDKNQIDQACVDNQIIIQNIPETIDKDALTNGERYIISIINNLSHRFTSLETNIDKINQRLNTMEENVNKRLSNMENNINLIYERQSLESLLKLLDSIYLITAERLETRTYYSDESDLTLKFFRFVSKQLIKHYSTR
jgi:hypothetical protein